jgi:gamma-tubulin complex component 3
VLLRDLVFVLQGTEGTLIQMNERSMSLCVIPTIKISQSVREVVDALAECGTLCYKIRKTISFIPASNGGSIRQSLYRAIEIELREYLKIVACFEATIANNTDGNTMTLRKALAWFNESKIKLKFLNALLQECQNLHGGQIITAVHKYLSHGHLDISSMASLLVDEVLRPFYSTLVEFVRHGNLQDPHNEFFIQKNQSTGWLDGYNLDLERLPTVIPEDMAAKVLLAGKTRSFLASFADSMDIEDVFDDVISQTGDIISLIKKEHQLACQQLSHLLTEKYSMRSHLRAVRDFIYFGRGDFASALIEFSKYSLQRVISDF